MHSGLLSSQVHESFFVSSLVGGRKKIEENCEQNSDMNSNIGETSYIV